MGSKFILLLFLSAACLISSLHGYCSFPFIYRGVTYNSCTRVNYHTYWCSLTRVFNGTWQECDQTIFNQLAIRQLKRKVNVLEKSRITSISLGQNNLVLATVNGRTGTICDDVIDSNQNGARVLCRQLGLRTRNARILDITGPSSYPIVLDDVRCTGRESNINQCRYSLRHNCRHSEDVALHCH